MVLEDLFSLLLHFLPVHPYFYLSTIVFTRPNDGWAGLCMKLCSPSSRVNPPHTFPWPSSFTSADLSVPMSLMNTNTHHAGTKHCEEGTQTTHPKYSNDGHQLGKGRGVQQAQGRAGEWRGTGRDHLLWAKEQRERGDGWCGKCLSMCYAPGWPGCNKEHYTECLRLGHDMPHLPCTSVMRPDCYRLPSEGTNF